MLRLLLKCSRHFIVTSISLQVLKLRRNRKEKYQLPTETHDYVGILPRWQGKYSKSRNFNQIDDDRRMNQPVRLRRRNHIYAFSNRLPDARVPFIRNDRSGLLNGPVLHAGDAALRTVMYLSATMQCKGWEIYVDLAFLEIIRVVSTMPSTIDFGGHSSSN
jgi:hypothetical protein